MPHEPAKKETNSAGTSDWECTNCGATLTGVNNSQIAARSGESRFPCICAAGIFIVTRNSPFLAINQPKGKAAQQKNQGGGESWPGA